MDLLKNILTGRLWGHPIHMMLVHFPAALFPVGAAFSLLSFLFNDKSIALMNFYIICTGSAIGWIALIFGAIDLFKIPVNTKPFRIALTHGGLNILWLSVFTIVAGAQFKYYPAIPTPSLIVTITETITAIFMLYSNYLGGELILKFGVGTKFSGYK